MNYLYLYPDEIFASSASIRQDRINYVLSAHELSTGVNISIVAKQGRGKATVSVFSKSEISLTNLEFREKLPSRLNLELIMAVPRPQTLKKVLQAGAAFGIEAIHFVKTQNVVKSYLQSPSLNADKIELEFLKSLEQVGDAVFPEVKIWSSLRDFFAGHKFSENQNKIIAHTSNAKMLSEIIGDVSAKTLLAIGPESGWTSDEVSKFLDLGFLEASLGERMLRVEHAVVAGLARVSGFVI